MMEYKISVIIPVYNAEKYIDKCIQSVLDQTIKGIEIILINDGSTDESEKKCEVWFNLYKNITLINKKNEGQGEARNIGLDIAKGKYIFFLDADDYLPNNSLETLYSKILEKDYDVVCGKSLSIFKNGKKIENNNFLNLNECEGSGTAIIKLTKYKNIPPTIWLYMYKSEFLKKNKIKFAKGVFLEDCEFNLKVYYYAKKMLFINNVTYCQFMSENSTMRSSNFKKSKDAIQIAKNIEQFIIENVNDKKVDKYFRNYVAYLYSYSIHYSMQIGYDFMKLFRDKKEFNHIIKSLLINKKYFPLALALTTRCSKIYEKLYKKYYFSKLIKIE